MRCQEKSATGPEFLRLATALLQTARLSAATGGMWEAADIQWWWRRDQHPDPRAQMFVMDGNTPHAAVVLTSWDARWQWTSFLPRRTTQKSSRLCGRGHSR